MIRRLPVLPTLLVLIAVAVMLRLGFWQLDRLQQKQALLARYTAAQAMSAEARWPGDAATAQAALYRRAQLDCRSVVSFGSTAGRNAAGATGLAHFADCRLAGGGTARIVLGWSADPRPRDWRGGMVTGIIAPGGKLGPRLVAHPPLAGLIASEPPDPSRIPNNHLAYAVQWFLFAATALVIYALALRKRRQ